MEKYMEENESNLDREDEVRINKKDISKSTWTGRGFVTLDQIEDKEETEIEGGKTNTEEDNEGDHLSLSEELQKEKKIKELKKEVLKFHQGEGVASVFSEEAKDDRSKHEPIYWGHNEKLQKEDEFAGIEKEISPRKSRRKTGEPVNSMAPEKSFGRYEVKKHKKDNKDKAAGKDNLKTIPDSKKQRSFGQKIKDFFTRQLYKETPILQREEEWDTAEDWREVPDEVLLNGKPMDNRFLDQEDRAA